MDRDVFISYSSHDTEAANRICDELERNGIVCWIAPRDVPIGAAYADALLRGLESSSTVVLLFSSQANRSRHVLREIELAMRMGKSLLVVRIDAAMPEQGMAYYLNPLQWLDASDGITAEHLAKLLESVRALKSRQTDTVTPAQGEQTDPARMPGAPTKKISSDIRRTARTWLVFLGAMIVLAGLIWLSVKSCSRAGTSYSVASTGVSAEAARAKALRLLLRSIWISHGLEWRDIPGLSDDTPLDETLLWNLRGSGLKLESREETRGKFTARAEFDRDSLDAFTNLQKAAIRRLEADALSAEADSRIGDALRLHFESYRLACTLPDTLALNLTVPAGPDAAARIRLHIESLIRTLNASFEDAERYGRMVRGTLQFSLRGYPAREVKFSYMNADGRPQFATTDSRGQIQLTAKFETDANGAVLPLEILPGDGEMKGDRLTLTEFEHLTQIQPPSALIKVPFKVPGMAAHVPAGESPAGTQPDWNRTLKVLSQIQTSSELLSSLRVYERNGRLSTAADAASLLSNGRRVYAAIVDERQVAALLLYDGQHYTDVNTGESHTSIGSVYPGYRIVWFAEGHK